MATETATKLKCQGCDNEAGALQCPKCLDLGVKDSFFCSQDCFKRNWFRTDHSLVGAQNEHKALHKLLAGKSANGILDRIRTPKVVSKPDPATGHYNPFPSFGYTGSLRPVYPLSPMRTIPAGIVKPDWADAGTPQGERKLMMDPRTRNKVDILDAEGQQKMRDVCRIGREILDIIAAEVKPGVTTDYLDEICHKATIERKAYPSPLNYNQFPKSFCSSINEVICHGIPDQRKLEDGDIINLDVSVYKDGHHADLNETYYVGDKAKADPDSVRVVETARECLEEAAKLIKPGTLIREFGNAIEKHAKSRNCGVVRTYCGHGVNTHFHSPPNVPHYAKNKAVGECKPGMTFTIEPMITLGRYKDVTWPDNWTSTTVDGKRTAQFEHTFLVTETGVEVLTARLDTSPGGPIPMPTAENGTNGK
ncbi:peptidase M24, structural domain-containing protein [Xylariaceae sp. FL1019]|nr:peptidase M24, structural domain-containing protein [Xylariaceae sp. FL1019]